MVEARAQIWRTESNRAAKTAKSQQIHPCNINKSGFKADAAVPSKSNRIWSFMQFALLTQSYNDSFSVHYLIQITAKP